MVDNFNFADELYTVVVMTIGNVCFILACIICFAALIHWLFAVPDEAESKDHEDFDSYS